MNTALNCIRSGTRVFFVFVTTAIRRESLDVYRPLCQRLEVTAVSIYASFEDCNSDAHEDGDSTQLRKADNYIGVDRK
jgi:hypothetical protein